MTHDQVIFRVPGDENFHFWKGTFEVYEEDTLAHQTEKDIYIIKPFGGNKLYILHPAEKVQLTLNELMTISLDLAPKDVDETNNIAQPDYISFIQDAISALKSGMAEKIVLARKLYQEKPEQFSLSHAVGRLHQMYPEAFVSCLLSENLGNWLGASPEVLLTNTDAGWKTVALAGTQKVDQTNTWGYKETLEHAKVMQYIEEILQAHHLQYNRSELDSIRMGHLSHMYASYIGEQKLTDQLAAKLINALSPTPAVCGVPKDIAQDYILNHEPFDRELYTGCWGPKIAGNWHLYVNLRCSQLYQNHLAFYAGGGINSLSDPEAEWLETVEKLKLLSDVLLAD